MDKWLKTGKLKENYNEEITDTENNVSNENISEPSTSGLLSLKKGRNTDKEVSSKENIHKKRKYDDSYLNYGFYWTGNENEPNGLCVECEKEVPNSSLNPAKLQRHFKKMHPLLIDKNIEYFKRKRDELKKRGQKFSKFMFNDNKSSLEASYRVSYRIGKAGEAYTIGEKLIKACAKDLIMCKIGEKFTKEIDNVALSDTTVARRIKDISDFCEKELICRLKNSPHGFTLQIDESTDVAGLAILLVLVRYVFDSTVYEDLLLCTPLPAKTTGEQIFETINAYMKKHKLSWDSCFHICTDGAKSLVGVHKGAISRIKAIATHIQHSHCCLHRHALAIKRMPNDLKDVLDNAVKIVNYIKSRDLNSRLFKLLCEELSSEHKILLLHTEVRWLSRGKVLNRFYELKDEIRIFLIEHKHELADKLCDENWLQSMTYLADIFSIFNEMNISLQGITTNIFKVNNKIEAMISKLDLWKTYVNRNDLQCFQKLNDFLASNELFLNNVVQKLILEHLSNLQKTFRDYFPSTESSYMWIQNPFQNLNSEEDNDLPLKEKEQLIEISKDYTLKAKFEPGELFNFWLEVYKEYPEVSDRAVKMLMPFVTTYLCERAFSTYVSTKTKYRNALDAEPQIRLQITTIAPDFEQLCRQKQAQPSH